MLLPFFCCKTISHFRRNPQRFDEMPMFSPERKLEIIKTQQNFGDILDKMSISL